MLLTTKQCCKRIIFIIIFFKEREYIPDLDFLPVIFLNASPPSFLEMYNEPFKKWSCFQNCYRHPDQFGTKSGLPIYFNFNVHTLLAGCQHGAQEMINTHLVTDAQTSLVW